MSNPFSSKKKSSISKRKLSNVPLCPIQDTSIASAFKNDSYFITEPMIHTPISMPTLTSVKSTRESTIKRPESMLSVVASPHNFENGPVAYNRKLVKGYGKFLEDKGFISQREEARANIQKDIRKSFASTETKVINKDIQNLITSTIVNSQSHRPQTVLKQLSTNGEDDQMDKYFERYKKVANRILGVDLDNNHLFVKVQQENITSAKSKRLNTALNSSHISTNDSIAKYRDYAASISKSIGSSLLFPKESRKSKGRMGIVASTLNELTRQTTENYDESKLVTETHDIFPDLKVASVTSIDDDIQDKVYDKAESLNDLPSITPFGQQGRSISQPEGIKVGKSLLIKDKNTSDYHCLLSNASGLTQKVRKSSNSGLFEQNLHKNKKTNIAKIKKPNFRISSVGNSDENIHAQVKGNRVIKVKNGSGTGDSLKKINKLCDGAMKSTTNLVLKLRQQSMEVGKQYGKIDTEYEKMNYQNTMKNWELSVRQADVLKCNL